MTTSQHSIVMTHPVVPRALALRRGMGGIVDDDIRGGIVIDGVEIEAAEGLRVGGGVNE
jgi:hypothetical protein